MPDRKDPNVILIGAPKSGSTSLYRFLVAHPDVFMSPRKELHHFDARFRDWPLRDHPVFEAWGSEPLGGEASPHYLAVPYVPQRIHDQLPYVKLVAILREPISRAYSEWWMYYSRATEKLSFDDAIAENLRELEAGRDVLADEQAWATAYDQTWNGIVQRRAYVQIGHYAKQLQRYYELFPRSQVHVVLLEDLVAGQEEVLAGLCRFLDIPPLPGLDPEALRSNAALGKGWRPIFRVAHRLGIRRWFDRIPSGPKDWARRLVTRAGPPPKPTDAQRALLAGHYASHNAQLRELLGRDLSRWS